jgi:hypothetical protein
MNFKKSLGIFLFVLFTSQIFLVVSSRNMLYANFSAKQTEPSPFEEITFVSEAVPGVENVKSNIVRNGGFEEDDYVDGPEYFGYWGDGYEICNASYQDDVHGGSYGLYLAAKGTDQFAPNVYCSRSLTLIPERAYLVEDIALDLWFKVKANPDINEGAYGFTYVRVNTGSTNYFIYYMLTDDAMPSNQSTYGYFDVREPAGSWTQLQRNVTLDFEELFPSVPIQSNFYVQYIYFRAYTVTNPTGFIEILADDVSITNGTAFNYLSANGDFEDGFGTNWPNYKDGPTSVKLSDDDFTEGSSSLNITAQAYFEQASSYAECGDGVIDSWNVYPDGYYPTESGAVVFDFDWKYSDSSSGGYNQDAYFYFKLRNETFEVYVFFYLGDETDTVPNSNFTMPTYMYRYYAAPGFGNRDTWEHFHLDIYDYLQLENLQNLIPDYFYWRVNCGPVSDSYVTLLVDDFSIVADPMGDPSFEQDDYWHSLDPLNSWESSTHMYVNRTTDAHTGTYAANATAHSGVGGASLYRYAYISVDENLYTDFWWRLDELSGASTAYSYIYFRLDDSKYIYYVLGLNDATVFTNTSDYVYYAVEGQNQTGIWTNLFRNVQDDVFTAFGADNWNITLVWLSTYAIGASKASAIFDDIYFVRDVTGPEISDLAQIPPFPQYTESVSIEVDVVDNIGIASVELFYRIGSGSWFAVPMSNVAGNHYAASIPNYGYDSIIQYFIEAYDVHGYQSLLGSDLSPFEYSVIDLVDPYLVVDAPPTSEPINDTVIFNIAGLDVGSGTASFEITIDTELVFNDTSVPTEYIWETTYLDNGNHTIIFALEDNAGNIATVQLEYTISHPVPWYVRAKTFLQKWYPYITAGAGVLIVGSITLAIVIRVRKRRKVT